MAKSSAAFLVFLCLSMLIISIPEVEAKVVVKLNIKLLENGETNECDHKCSEGHGDCKQYLILAFAPVP
ncbi:unnamed protein product [Arabis nemorensis]|uniref:Uncharacterized protein n=1 Tax=Arabis nemorensis TaxID=586526 RepID=A0A565C4E6_9BRAS|nr:unnamed protein product [Arabis nemorensis]